MQIYKEDKKVLEMLGLGVPQDCLIKQLKVGCLVRYLDHRIDLMADVLDSNMLDNVTISDTYFTEKDKNKKSIKCLDLDYNKFTNKTLAGGECLLFLGYILCSKANTIYHSSNIRNNEIEIKVKCMPIWLSGKEKIMTWLNGGSVFLSYDLNGVVNIDSNSNNHLNHLNYIEINGKKII